MHPIIEAFQALDLEYKLLLGTMLALISVFHVVLPLYPTTKQRAWVLTTMGSAVMTTCSLPYVWHFASSRGDVVDLPRISWLADTACRFFQAYLVA
jgi:hypothetical protein